MTLRDRLVHAVLPLGPARPRPAFWRRFDAAAPLHLRAGVWVAVLALEVIWPRLHLRLGGLWSQVDRDRLLEGAARWPGLDGLLAVTRIVAGFASFDGEDA